MMAETDGGFLPPEIEIGERELSRALLDVCEVRLPDHFTRGWDLPAQVWRGPRVRITVEVLDPAGTGEGEGG